MGCASVPRASERSEWQTPVATMRTRTCPGPGSGSSISSTRSGDAGLAEHGGAHGHGSCSDLTRRNSSSP